jgi:hypothetical protein
MPSNVALLGESPAYFLGGALATFVAVHIGIPFLSQRWGISPVIAWFLTSGVLMAFFFCAALAAARRQTGSRSFTGTLNALRLHRPNRADLAWAAGWRTSRAWSICASSAPPKPRTKPTRGVRPI